MRTWVSVTAIVALLAAAFLGGRATIRPVAAATPSASGAPTVTVTGSGTVHITPDEASVDLGVTANASSAEAAMAADNKAMGAVAAAIEGAGVDAKDVRTFGINLNTTYNRGHVTGFQASNTVEVTLHSVAKVGPIIDKALAAGANRVMGVSFGLSDPQPAQRQAYTAAVSNAHASAQALAAAAGMHLGAIRSISVGGGTVYPLHAASFATAAAPAAPTPVFGGQQTVTVQVQVVYELTQ